MRVLVLTWTGNDDWDDKTIDTKDTSHDDGDDGLDDEFGLEDGDGADADTGLGSTVGGAHVAENESRHNAHTAEEKSLVGISVHYTSKWISWVSQSLEQDGLGDKFLLSTKGMLSDLLTENWISSCHI